jgi:hypothetical protein
VFNVERSYRTKKDGERVAQRRRRGRRAKGEEGDALGSHFFSIQTMWTRAFSRTRTERGVGGGKRTYGHGRPGRGGRWSTACPSDDECHVSRVPHHHVPVVFICSSTQLPSTLSTLTSPSPIPSLRRRTTMGKRKRKNRTHLKGPNAGLEEVSIAIEVFFVQVS